MSHFLPRRALYALVLVGALVACSAPPQQSQPAPAGTADDAGGIAAGPSASAAPPPATSGTPNASAQSAAQARVQAAREQATKAQAQAAQAAAEQCQDIATQIRAEQTTEREAPSTSIDEDIVAATLAKADKRIDRLQQQYDSLGCPDSDLPATHARAPQLPPAPGALPP